MGQHIVKQPNGKYAIFSSNVDHFIAYDATPEEIRELRRAESIKEAESLTKRGLERADAGGDAIFQEDLDMVRAVHGNAVAAEYEELLSKECGTHSVAGKDEL